MKPQPFDLRQGTQKHTLEKKSLFNKWFWKIRHPHTEVDPKVSPCTRINTKWIKNLNVKTWPLETTPGKQKNSGRYRHR
jgi:hypothetical protein